MSELIDPMQSGLVLARWWHQQEDGRIQCDLCPRLCRLHEGQRGLCFVRGRLNDQMVLTTYGRSSGFCIDPIEKKPLYHFYPGSKVLSFGTAGCNLACKFCQNWDISKSREMDRLQSNASPEAIAKSAQQSHARSVAFTYNDPVIFAEYAMDTASHCRALGIKTVAVSAGYILPEPRAAFFALMDAANIDLKAFTDDFYVHQTGSHLSPVLEALEYIAHDTDCWLEITTLLIPGLNDSAAEIKNQCRWILTHLGDQIPLHFSAFHPAWKMQEIPKTPPETVIRARRIGLDTGLKHVYTGNIEDREGGKTHCAQCAGTLIERSGYRILANRLSPGGLCPDCAQPLKGRFMEG